jgi:hypothetical protein
MAAGKSVPAQEDAPVQVLATYPSLTGTNFAPCYHFVDYAPSKNPPKFRKITSNISNFTFPSILSTAFTLKAKIPPTDSQ